MTPKWISPFFALAAIYDAVIGVAFLFASDAIFRWVEIAPPNHPGYVQFPAALLIVFAIMFTAIALEPQSGRNLILFGVLLKISYCGVVLFHWLGGDLPWIWKPFWFADLIFLVLFLLAWKSLSPRLSGATPPAEGTNSPQAQKS